jgi:hypothetical protein
MEGDFIVGLAAGVFGAVVVVAVFVVSPKLKIGLAPEGGVIRVVHKEVPSDRLAVSSG